MKDGTTRPVYKPEHAVDLDTGVVVAAELHLADEGYTTTLAGTLRSAEAKLASVDAAPSVDQPSECIADKGYHSCEQLKSLKGGAPKTRIAEPERKGLCRWHGDGAERRAGGHRLFRQDGAAVASLQNDGRAV
jgi:hypothetical protein